MTAKAPASGSRAGSAGWSSPSGTGGTAPATGDQVSKSVVTYVRAAPARATAVVAGSFDPSDYSAFQAVFGMIFTVIIALEFKKSLLVVAERKDRVVQIQAVVVIALLAVCRKVLILDLAETDAWHILSLAAAILALGGVYWLIRDRDRADEAAD